MISYCVHQGHEILLQIPNIFSLNEGKILSPYVHTPQRCTPFLARIDRFYCFYFAYNIAQRSVIVCHSRPHDFAANSENRRFFTKLSKNSFFLSIYPKTKHHVNVLGRMDCPINYIALTWHVISSDDQS